MSTVVDVICQIMRSPMFWLLSSLLNMFIVASVLQWILICPLSISSHPILGCDWSADRIVACMCWGVAWTLRIKRRFVVGRPMSYCSCNQQVFWWMSEWHFSRKWGIVLSSVVLQHWYNFGVPALIQACSLLIPAAFTHRKLTMDQLCLPNLLTWF